jgi:hypothetical protein
MSETTEVPTTPGQPLEPAPTPETDPDSTPLEPAPDPDSAPADDDEDDAS